MDGWMDGRINHYSSVFGTELYTISMDKHEGISGKAILLKTIIIVLVQQTGLSPQVLIE